MKKRILSLVLIMMMLLSACGAPKKEKPKVDHDIIVSQDTYVLNKDINAVDKSDTSFENETILHLKTPSGSSLTRYIYLKFDISGLKGDNEFSCIELGFTIYHKENGSNQPVTINVYGCASNWEDKDVTYNNQPIHYSLVSSRSDITAYNVEYNFPVTDYIKQHLKNGETTVAFVLKEATPTAAKQIQIYSKENSLEYAPNLSVSYSKIDNNKYTSHQLEFYLKV